MNIPKMSQWVIGSGIVIWSVSLIFSAIFYCYSGGTVFDAGGFRCASFSVPSSLIMPAVNPFLVAESLSQLGWYGRVLIIFAVPYIAIPLYWFVLHQIDTAIKRKRGAGAGTNAQTILLREDILYPDMQIPPLSTWVIASGIILGVISIILLAVMA